MQKVQLIPLDETAARAVEYIQSSNNIIKTSLVLSDIAMICKEGYQHILVTSDFNEEILYEILNIIKKGLIPILFFNENAFELNESQVIKYLLVSNCILFPISNEKTTTLTYAQYLEIFIEIYTLQDHESNIKLNEKDILTILHSNALCYLYTATDISLYTSITQLYNKYQSMLQQSSSLLVNFFAQKDTPLLMIIEAMEILDPLISDMTNCMFQVSTKQDDELYKISMINTIDVSIQEIIQNEINKQKTYFQKLSIIVENCKKGFLKAEEANVLGEKNDIDPNDIKEFLEKLQKENIVP